ncbi:hypothetical protein [Fibrella forsythiae]|uniref:Uncharacterized protein n=1 Tax=Fibrella forsythiae TaxID=2817061 RepID=A0ABS3JDP0_9BACT|nr:hypothetical protein [Fibrella forsythiae]MBO0948115.1 hypothetical protein [Fibrella forsythiae]
MARQDPHTEYIISKEAYQIALSSLPATGTAGQKATSLPITAMQYRQNISNTINAGKWSMWGISQETFDFQWHNGTWQPPVNLIIRQD